jgi:hypothetical protein
VVGSDPVYLADERNRYFLDSLYSPFQKENIDLKVNAAGLLTSFSTKSESELSDIVTGLAKSSISRESALTSGTAPVFQAQIDVAELAFATSGRAGRDRLASLNARINRALRTALTTFRADFDKAPVLKRLSDSGGTFVALEIERLTPFAGPDKSVKPDCSVGFCYRLPVAYLVAVNFPGGVRQETIVTVPNGSPTYVARLNRGVFANWTNTLTLNNGMLTGYQYETSRSELLAAVTLPFDVVGATIAAITQNGKLFSTKTSRLEAETKYLEALAKAEAQINPESNRRPSPAFEFSFGSGPNGARFGQPLSQGTNVTAPPSRDGTIIQPDGSTSSGSDGSGG